jgi:hypothetical protein
MREDELLTKSSLPSQYRIKLITEHNNVDAVIEEVV